MNFKKQQEKEKNCLETGQKIKENQDFVILFSLSYHKKEENFQSSCYGSKIFFQALRLNKFGRKRLIGLVHKFVSKKVLLKLSHLILEENTNEFF